MKPPIPIAKPVPVSSFKIRGLRATTTTACRHPLTDVRTDGVAVDCGATVLEFESLRMAIVSHDVDSAFYKRFFYKVFVS